MADRHRTAGAGRLSRWMSLATTLAVFAGADVSFALAADAWSIAKPYANNPLREASTVGTVRAGETTEATTLTVGCRADDDGAVMTASFEVPETLDFPLENFDGPGADGENEKLLSVTIGRDEPTAYNVSGWHSGGERFTFSFLLPKEEASRWQARSGDELALAVHLATSNDPSPTPLRTELILPDRADGLSDVIAPCLEATTFNQ